MLEGKPIKKKPPVREDQGGEGAGRPGRSSGDGSERGSVGARETQSVVTPHAAERVICGLCADFRTVTSSSVPRVKLLACISSIGLVLCTLFLLDFDIMYIHKHTHTRARICPAAPRIRPPYVFNRDELVHPSLFSWHPVKLKPESTPASP